MRDAWKIERGEMDERTRSATGAIIGPVLSLKIANEKALMTRDTETGIDKDRPLGNSLKPTDAQKDRAKGGAQFVARPRSCNAASRARHGSCEASFSANAR